MSVKHCPNRFLWREDLIIDYFYLFFNMLNVFLILKSHGLWEWTSGNLNWFNRDCVHWSLHPYRTSPIIWCLVLSFVSKSFRCAPTLSAFPLKSSFSITSRTARPIAQDTGFPPNCMESERKQIISPWYMQKCVSTTSFAINFESSRVHSVYFMQYCG